MDTNKKSEIRLNEDGKRIPTRADGLAAILRYLMTYCVCPTDEDYNRRAVDYLLRKLQDNKRELRELIETITWRGNRPSKCFTIPRTLDGRFQVAMRKGFPHVVYARIWRWKDLEKCFIIHIPTCKFGYDLNRDHICVNPYHYKKVTTAEEFYSRPNFDSDKYKGKPKPIKKKKEAARSQNIAVNDGGKKQDMSQQQTQENLIPIFVEQHSNAPEYIKPQQSHLLYNYVEEPKEQPQIPETYPICDTLYANNNIESAVPSGSINDQCGLYNLHQPAMESNVYELNGVKQNNTPLQLHSGSQENENNFIQDNRNVETPAVSLSMCEQVLLNQSDFQNLSLSNNHRQDNFEKINLPAPSNTLLVNNPSLVSNCNQPSQDLVRGDFRSVPINTMPPPVPMNQLPPPVPMNGMPPLLSMNRMPPPVPTTELPPSVLMNEMPPPRKKPLSSNSMFVNSNRQINLPPPSSTPLPNNPPTYSHSLFEDEDFQSTERQHNELPSNYSPKLENKNMTLNCTLERILAEDDNQQTASNNPLENTLNETLDQILSQVQNNDKQLSSIDKKLEGVVLSNNTEPITTQSNIEQVLNSNADLADSVPMEVSNCKEIIHQENNQQLQPISNASHLIQDIEALSPISDVPPTDNSQKLENKDTSFNCTLERILKEDNSQQATSHNPLEYTLNETLDHILSQVQNNDQKQSSTDQKLENAVLSNNTESITTQSNIEVLESNEDLAEDNVPMEVSNCKEIIHQDSNQQFQPINNASHLIQDIEALSPICDVPPTNCSQKLENKDTSLNCTLERILKEDNSQQATSHNPLEYTLNETLDQILSQVQNNDKKQSSTDQKFENAVLSNNTESITTQSNIEVLESNEDLAEDNVPMEVSNCKEIIHQDNNQQFQPINNASHLIQDIEALSPICDVPPTNCSQKLENKDTSLNCTFERILAEDNSQQTASHNPLEYTLNETLDQILSQVQNNDQKQSSTDQKLESAVLSNNTESITTQSNIEVLNSNEDVADDNVPMEVSNCKEIIHQDNNQQLQPISNASHLIQDIEALSPISNVPPTDNSQKLENKDPSFNCTLERILTEDCTLERVLKEDISQKTTINNPIDNTLNETLGQILSEVQNNDQKLSSTEQKLDNALLNNNNTKPTTTQSNIKQVVNCNEDLVDEDVPMEVSIDEEMIEQKNNQQLQPISNASQLTQNIKAVSPISAVPLLSPTSASTPLSSLSSITALSPVSTIRSLSPISNTQPLSLEQFQCDSNLRLLDSDDKKTTGESSKYSTKQNQLQSDKAVFKCKDEDLQETMTRNNNAQKKTSLHFSNTMISFINNNIMEQTQMSSVSKCEHYLRHHSGETNSVAHIQPPTNNNNNNPHLYNETTILQTFQNSCMHNNAQQDHNPVQPKDAELQRSNFNEFFNMPNMNCRNTKNLIPIDDPPLEHWCSIDYFELDTQVGETFKVKNEHTTAIVDGYLDPDSGNRFCLGRLTNIRRTEQSERTRMHIAQGIALELRNEGDIWLQCRSKNSVFIQAHFLNMQADRSRRNSVYKIFSGECKKVFDLQRCYKHIKAQIATAQAALKVQQMSVGPPGCPVNNLCGSKGLEAIDMTIDDLRRLCILQISFVKGWGSDYPRQTIKETPCWIEVHIHRALQILDNFLLLDKPIVRGMD